MAFNDKTLDLLDLRMLASTGTLLGGKRPGENVGELLSRSMQSGNQAVANLQANQLALDTANLKNQKLAMETAKLAKEAGIGLNPADDVAIREYTRSQQEEDRLIPEAFGAFDALQVGLAKVGSPLGIESRESLTASTAKTELNKSI